MNKKKRKMISTISFVLIILYGAVIIYFTLFSDRLGRMNPYETYRYNLIPFTEIHRFIQYRHQVSMEAFLINIIGNVVVFMPWGFLLPIWIPGKIRWYHIILYSFSFTFCIETMQLISHVGVFDVDDLIMNTIGGVAGWIIYKILNTVRLLGRRLRS